ncbi:oligosaccharide flippase family protein [bacterium]|nr:oligosaccharide flippase family protein [bacterium]
MTDDLKARVVRGVGWSALRTWGARLSSFIVFPILARILGPETYGLVALAGVWLMVLDIFSNASFGAAIEQRKDLEPEHLDTVFWAFLGLGVLLTAASILGAPQVAAFFDEPDLTPVVRWLSLGFLMQMTSGVQTSLLRRELRMGALAGSSLGATVIGSGLGIGMALGGFGVWSIVGQRLTTRVLNVVFVWHLSSWRPSWRFSRQHFQDVAGFGFSVMGNRVLYYLNRQVDQLLIGRYLGKVELGYYFTSSRLYTLTNNMLIGTFSQVAMPAMARLQEDPARFRRAYVSVSRYVCVVAFPVFLGLHLLAEEFILVLTGPDWKASIPALQVLALVGVVHALQYVNGAAMMALGRADLRLATQVVHSVVNVVGFFIAVRHGFVAVATAYTVRAWLLLPLDLLISRHIGAVSLKALGIALWPQVLAAIVMAAGVHAMKTTMLETLSPVLRLLLGTGIGATIYVLTIGILDRRLWREGRTLLLEAVGRRRQEEQEPR